MSLPWLSLASIEVEQGPCEFASLTASYGTDNSLSGPYVCNLPGTPLHAVGYREASDVQFALDARSDDSEGSPVTNNNQYSYGPFRSPHTSEGEEGSSWTRHHVTHYNIIGPSQQVIVQNVAHSSQLDAVHGEYDDRAQFLGGTEQYTFNATTGASGPLAYNQPRHMSGAFPEQHDCNIQQNNAKIPPWNAAAYDCMPEAGDFYVTSPGCDSVRSSDEDYASNPVSPHTAALYMSDADGVANADTELRCFDGANIYTCPPGLSLPLSNYGHGTHLIQPYSESEVVNAGNYPANCSPRRSPDNNRGPSVAAMSTDIGQFYAEGSYQGADSYAVNDRQGAFLDAMHRHSTRSPEERSALDVHRSSSHHYVYPQSASSAEHPISESISSRIHAPRPQPHQLSAIARNHDGDLESPPPSLLLAHRVLSIPVAPSPFAPRAPIPVEETPKKPLTLACLFCRKRKIACGSPPMGARDRTCNQCARRNLKCVYPEVSRRGMRPKALYEKDTMSIAGIPVIVS